MATSDNEILGRVDVDDIDSIMDIAAFNDDVDTVEHAVKDNAEAIFTWNYEKGERPRLDRLYEKAKTSQWNATTDLDWSIEVDPTTALNLEAELLLDPDLLARDRDRTTDTESKVRATARAHRRGKKGWIVGGRETRLPRSGGGGQGGGTRGELTKSHLRCGHFHAVRCGKGRSEIKVMWFPPTVVRPDLPTSQSRGYKAAS